MKYCLLCLALALTGCQTNDKLASCKGPIFPLNVGRWQPLPSDLQRSNAGGRHEGV
ncbi:MULTISPECIES: type IV secretion system lipoprotein VirB7 [Rhizobium]|uniref:Type IV secretion system lipoprotein VirB7 n=1 Tax=Rhizobium tumorigenes TaxID=2041385 RepID=A0AAF1KRI5_9HYPH|nr:MULTISPECIES: type IV secretion system lipoprotein VirB7 [Rhizobium]MBO9102329.1 type IV secretion system lipoprotein VirB7 [Rhizobium sp. L58/93]MBO9172385.1 type IV secretion system lipoprotein VirB7 [Rhizobium sp. L245/93]MBO9188132.1 type IV secretion system lipoprotein VirB7 [Rhizobium sp. E27B/91]QXZ87570.1 type IV secretion system lipoprotein VirB7 [Rhizobium sp. K1/93]QXZ87665.1 type IV secretion system lipoprotein VirB7 [Rhizobium sp. K1/93]